METLELYTQKLAMKNKHTWEKETTFVLLQLINGLKSLQAQGIEEVNGDTLQRFLLVRADQDPQYRMIILDQPQDTGEKCLNLCKTALASMLMLFQIKDPVSKALNSEKLELPELTPSVGMFHSMALILQTSTSMALGQVKSMLEYMLWGPSDVAFEANNQINRESSLQRWLDLERANVLNQFLRSHWRMKLTVFEEYHLLFLVQTCAKMLYEASLLFESQVASM